MNLKKRFFVYSFVCAWIAFIHAQEFLIPPVSTVDALHKPRIKDRHAHGRTWEWGSRKEQKSGGSKRRVIELASGMHVKEKGEWVEAPDELILKGEKAVGRAGPFRVVFFPNPNTAGAIQVTIDETTKLRSHILGLFYHDTRTGRSAQLSRLQDTTGEMGPGLQVVYPNLFSGVAADLRLTWSAGHFEQDVLLRERPLPPEHYGMDPATTRLEVLTEFLEAPRPRETPRRLRHARIPDLIDTDLFFEHFHMGVGAAFASATANDSDLVATVGKFWLNGEDRTFLIESVPYTDLVESMSALPEVTSPLPAPAPDQRSAQRFFPPAPGSDTPQGVWRSQQIAAVADRPAVLLDYRGEVASAEDFTFRGNETYLISGNVHLTGRTIFEGGAVIKFASSNAPMLTIAGPFEFHTGPFRPVIFTASDDDTVGEQVPGSSGNPLGYYAAVCLKLNGPGELRDCFFRYAQTAVHWTGAAGTIENAQASFCGTAFRGFHSDLQLFNVLVHDCEIALEGNPVTFSILHGTFNRVDLLARTGDARSFGLVRLTNSILSAIPSLGRTVHWEADYNATFQTSPLVQIHGVSLQTDPFLSVGAAGHYLSDSSELIDRGSSALSPAQRAALREKTVRAPQWIGPAFYTASVTFTNRVLGDRLAPDLGYHYDEVDYVFNRVAISSGDLRILPGTAIAVVAGPSQYGIGLLNGAKLFSIGNAETLNWITGWPNVMEPANAAPPDERASIVTTWREEVSPPEAYAQFTGFARMGNVGRHVHAYYGNARTVKLRDCLLYGGNVLSSRPPMEMRNCFSSGVDWFFDGFDYPLNVAFENSHLEGGQFILENYTGGTVRVLDSWLAWDRVSLAQPIVHFHNGYSDNKRRLLPHHPGDIVGNVPFVRGRLGFSYQDQGSPLVNKGSRTAGAVGLFRYTAVLNQIPEGDSPVDIGFHWPALGPDGKPDDSDADGLADYIEDSNGDGVIDSRDGNDDADGDGVVDRQDARRWNPLIQLFRVTIEAPVNGAVIE